MIGIVALTDDTRSTFFVYLDLTNTLNPFVKRL